MPAHIQITMAKKGISKTVSSDGIEDSMIDGNNVSAETKDRNENLDEDNENSSKATVSEVPPEEASETVDEETWDLARVLPASRDNGVVAPCSTENCPGKAVAVWISSLEPDEEWLTCETCQAADFGGWPEGIKPNDKPQDVVLTTNLASITDRADELTKNSEGKDTEDEQSVEDPETKESTAPSPFEVNDGSHPVKDTKTDTPTNLEAASPDDNDEETVETWELKRIMSIEDITGSEATKCMSESCSLLAACLYVSSLDPASEWYTCVDCQELDYDGWPELNELPIQAMSQKHKDALKSHCSKSENVNMPNFEICTGNSMDDMLKPGMMLGVAHLPSPDGEEVWDLTKIMSIHDIKECPVKCSTETCTLPAACIYKSNFAPSTKWYSCLDCQENDYGGWPDHLSELPVTYLTDDHQHFLISQCSKRSDVDMPNFDGAAASPVKDTESIDVTNTLFTPPPNGSTVQNGISIAMANVTPSPAAESAKVGAAKGNSRPSKQLIALHRKWQDAAESMGGPEARIVVSKPMAKKLVFDLMYDAFRPMNITDIHKGLKAIVPSPVLKACLDDMAFDQYHADVHFAESDDEDGGKKEKAVKRDPKYAEDSYAGALSFKVGRNSNTSLYYVDHSKLKNNGNGIPRDERDELLSAFHKTKAEEAALKAQLLEATKNTTQLLSEPTNEAAIARLESEEAALTKLQEAVEAGRKLKVNEQQKDHTKRRIDSMTGQWRKRRRICMDFLIAMEENTEGIVSVKKCLGGDGQIEIDSDQAIVTSAVAFGNKKRSRTLLAKKVPVGSLTKKAKTSHESSSLSPNEAFVAVTLNSQGLVERIYLDS